MDEVVNRKELEGIGGWLVLFQIHIIMCVVSTMQSLIVLSFMGWDMVLPSFKPYYIIVLVAALAVAIICIILFYTKRKAFRPVFVVYGIIALISTAAYVFYGIDLSNYTAEFGQYASYLESLVKSVSYVSLVISTGIVVAFIIALYKSQRVKNTFIK